MKKILLGIFVLMNIGMVGATSLIQPDLDKIVSLYRLNPNNTERELSLTEFKNYQPCKQFTQMQHRYQIIRSLNFIGEFGVKTMDSRSKYITYFSKLASSTPKNLIQQSLFPYGNSMYAKQGIGTQLFCEGENDNFYQMGVLQLKGHIVFQDRELQGIDEEYGNIITTTTKESYFLISEYKDPNVENLPYLTMIEGKKAIRLGCFSQDLINGEIYSYYFGSLSVKIDTVHNTYAITSAMLSKQLEEDILKKSAAHPDKEITIIAQLTPNVIFDHGLDIPCENSRIQDIEIVDDAGL